MEILIVDEVIIESLEVGGFVFTRTLIISGVVIITPDGVDASVEVTEDFTTTILL